MTFNFPESNLSAVYIQTTPQMKEQIKKIAEEKGLNPRMASRVLLEAALEEYQQQSS